MEVSFDHRDGRAWRVRQLRPDPAAEDYARARDSTDAYDVLFVDPDSECEYPATLRFSVIEAADSYLRAVLQSILDRESTPEES